ncbi:MAG: histidinol dehydrogenase [Nitrospiraceae bacterium]|nr:histidinol dehydrogenase [Nitrospiraceae bacterium]
MRIITGNKGLSAFLRRLRKRGSSVSPAIEKAVRKILSAVEKNGDRAVLRYTSAFDRIAVKRLQLGRAEIERAAGRADKTILRALETAADRIRRFHERQMEKTWTVKSGGALLGQSIRPIKRVGVYVPGGKAAYPSTVLMNVIPAQVAGVKEIAVCVPTPDGMVNPYVMAALRMLGVTEVYRIGGAQAVAALAYGTKTIRRVDKIVGPGNIYVATAKRMVFGTVDIDMIAGPSEILVIADDSADSAFIAADLLGQAEHDEWASSILLTDSGDLALRVAREVKLQLSRLARKKIARASLRAYGAVIVTGSIDASLRIANSIAPEHLEIMTQDPAAVLPGIENAGAIFLGPWTPEALGDYAAGPNHTLPTGGTARFFSPLGVYDFCKRSSILRFSRKGFMDLARVVETIADTEGLEAHGNSIRVRMAAAVKR